MRVGIIGGGFGLAVQAPIINTHPKMNVSAISTMIRHQVPKIYQLQTILQFIIQTGPKC